VSRAWPLEATENDDKPLPPPWDGNVVIVDKEVELALVSLQFPQPELAMRVCRRVFCRAEATGDEQAALLALLLACCNLYNHSQQELSDRVFAAILERMQGFVMSPRLSTQIKLFHSMRLSDQGELALAVLVRQSALATAMALGDNGLAIAALSFLAQAALQVDDGELTLELLEQQRHLLSTEKERALNSRSHRETTMATAWQAIAIRKRLAGDHGAAQTALQNARQLAQSACSTALDDRQALYALEALVHILVMLGCPEPARAQIAFTSATLKMVPSAGTTSWCLLRLALARVDVYEGAPAEKTLATLKAIERLQNPGSELHILVGDVQMLLLDVHQLSGRHEQALACHKRFTDWHAPIHSAELRQRIKLLRNAVLAMRAEAVEFITHDLLTPLAAAQTWMQALGRQHSEPAHLPSLREAQSLLDQTLTLADQYLGVLRAELLPRSQFQPLDIGALADDVCENAAPPAGVRLTRTIDVGTPVQGDATLLTRALTALLAHAFRRAPSGTQIGLSLSQDTVRGQAVLSIEHQGERPSVSVRTRLYQQSFDGDVFDLDSLGLALAAKVCRLHRMRLRFETVRGQGSRMRLTMKTAAGPLDTP
jgi:signal transduction histidine kinase